MDRIARQDQLDKLRTDVRAWQALARYLPEYEAVRLGLDLEDNALDMIEELEELRAA
ncbi:MAG TPA: hypothetical protein VFW09_17840 [Solirubrobacteraceae bacterium]|nr:hypothetical protein [Solirubrobacteraceae bacterium]